LELRDGHHRQLLDEQQKPHEEPTKAAEQNRVVDERRGVRSPLPWLVLVRQRRQQELEALEPHAKVDEQREDEEPRWIPAQPLGEERERQDHVAEQHEPRRPCPLPKDAIPEVLLLELAAAHPRDLE